MSGVLDTRVGEFRRIEQAIGHVAHELRYVRSLIYVALNSSRWGGAISGIILAVA